MEADGMKRNACCLLPCDLFSIPDPPPWTMLTSVQLGLSIPGHPSQKRLVILQQKLSSRCYSGGLLRTGQIRVSVVPCVRYVCYSLI